MKNLGPARPGEVNYHFVDRFTVIHFLIGCFYGFIGLGFYLTVFLAIGWELAENPLKSKIPAVFPHATADTIQNSCGDVLAVLGGWLIVQSI